MRGARLNARWPLHESGGKQAPGALGTGTREPAHGTRPIWACGDRLLQGRGDAGGVSVGANH
jgi:hypothetical protein